MKTAEFERWVAKVSKLTHHQRDVLSKQLQVDEASVAVERILETGDGKVMTCPHCKHAEIRL